MDNQLKKDIIDIEKNVVQWRHKIHQNPELSNREYETARMIAKHLEDLGLEADTGVAHTGVVAVLKGENPGKTLALRADIDALPITERNDLPFKSEKTTEFLGEKTGVMHACGHDAHTAILMGVVEVLSKNKHLLNGNVKFIFQPAEEGPPPGEKGGASLMIEEGVLQKPDVDAIFGLHIISDIPVGKIHYKPGGFMAANERFEISVKGKGAHGGKPWDGVDPILISSKIIDGLQTIISRESPLTNGPAVISVGKITSGTRFNVVPESAEMAGTLRTLDSEMREMIIRRMNEVVTSIAKAYGGEASIEFQSNTAITYNDLALTAKMSPTLKHIAGEENVELVRATTLGEDFSYFQEKVPGLFFFLGGMTPGNKTPYPHHHPQFKIDDDGMLLGVKSLTQLAIDYLNDQS